MAQNEKFKHTLMHLIEGLEVGGAEMLLIHYIQALGFEKYHHVVYSIGNDGPMRAKIEALGVLVMFSKKRASVKNPIRFFISILALIIKLIRFVKDNNVTIIQSHLNQSNKLSVVIGKICRLPAFPTVHNTAAFVYSRRVWDPRRHLNRWMDQLLYKRAESVIAISEEVKGVIIKELRIPKEKIIVLRNGIILNKTLKAEIEAKVARLKPSKKAKILAVGSLTYQKAFEVLIDAAALLVQDNINNFTIQIAGKGVERPMLEKLIKTHGLERYVELLGFRGDIYHLMQCADIFVIPSRYEGLSIAMIEAMSFGLPIIASDAPGLNTYIQHSQNGLLFPTEDSSALKERLASLINNKERRLDLGESGKSHYQKFFKMDENIKVLDKLYKTI